MNPSWHKMSVLAQIFKLIPRNLIPKLANGHGVNEQSRSFSPGSHVLALMFGQLSHALGLNDICNTLQNHSGALTTQLRLAVTGSLMPTGTAMLIWPRIYFRNFSSIGKRSAPDSGSRGVSIVPFPSGSSV